MVSEKPGSGGDMSTIFAAEIAKCTQKLAVVTGETLQISVKDFADLVVEENAPYSFKWYVNNVQCTLYNVHLLLLCVVFM